MLYFRRCPSSRVWLLPRWKCFTRWCTHALQHSSSASSPLSLHTFCTTGNDWIVQFSTSPHTCLTQITVHDSGEQHEPGSASLTSFSSFCFRWMNSFHVLSSIRITRKSWHTLLNTCFHIAMTTAVFAGGITLTSHPIACQTVKILISSSCTFPAQGIITTIHHVLLRWALFFTILHCPLCCGSGSAHGFSIRRLCGGLLSNQRVRLQRCPLSGPCSGQWCHPGDMKIRTWTTTCVAAVHQSKAIPVFSCTYYVFLVVLVWLLLYPHIAVLCSQALK